MTMVTQSANPNKPFNRWLTAQLVNACQSRSNTRSISIEKAYRTWGECVEVRTFVLNQSAWHYRRKPGSGKGQHEPVWKVCAQQSQADIRKAASRQAQEWNQLEYRQTFIINRKAYEERNPKLTLNELWATIAAIECQQMTIKLKHEYQPLRTRTRDWRYASYDALKQMKRLPENTDTYMRETLDSWELSYRRSMLAFHERFLCPWEAAAKQGIDQLKRQMKRISLNDEA